MINIGFQLSELSARNTPDGTVLKRSSSSTYCFELEDSQVLDLSTGNTVHNTRSHPSNIHGQRYSESSPVKFVARPIHRILVLSRSHSERWNGLIPVSLRSFQNEGFHITFLAAEGLALSSIEIGLFEAILKRG